MPETRTNSHTGRHNKRDFELCKVVFSAVTSQILYSRRAFPPRCFQLLPLAEVVSRSFEDIIASGSEIQVHDKELLRDPQYTVFLRQCANYGLNRFLGIMREDIFPHVETEDLAKFRISFLKTRTWDGDCLLEYYTVVFRYDDGGKYGLDIWRAGTGTQHVAHTDSQLWNLGDYLGRLPSWTDSLHWTLAFHATEQPADPPIGLWKFGRGEFEDANLTLQQRGGYGYTRIARLEVTALSSTEHKNLTTETSSNFQSVHLVDEVADMGPLSPEPLPQPALTMPERRKKSPTKITKKNRNSRPGPRRTGGAQMSPPLTLASSRNTSKDATADEGENLKKYPPNKAGTGISHGTKRSSKSVSRSRLGTKRRPKRPLQLFEDVTSSLPPTQIIGESQSLGHGSQIAKLDQPAGLVNTSTGQDWLVEDIPLSTSLDPSKLLDGVSLSSEALSPTQISPRVDLARLTSRSSNTEYRLRSGAFSDGRGSLRLEPSSSIVGPHEDMRQWELRTSPPVNLLGIAISDDEQDIKKAPEMEHGAPPHPAVGQSERPGISYAFSPHTVTRRTLFHDIHNSSDSEE